MNGNELITSIERGIYYTAERLLLGSFENLTGVRLGMKNLKRVKLIPFGSGLDEYILHIEKKLAKEFGLEVEVIGRRSVPRELVEWGSHVFVPYTAKFLLKEVGRAENSAILGVTGYQLSILPPLWSVRQLYHFHAILGISMPYYGVVLVTTLNDTLPTKSLVETSMHEIGHLMGKHGYPLWK